jgi:hypothetical protein
VLKIATWTISNLCEGLTPPPQGSGGGGGKGGGAAAAVPSGLPLLRLMPVLNACLDCPDAEVLSHVSWALSHLCDGPPDTIFAAMCRLRARVPPRPAAAMRLAPWLTPAAFASEAVGEWMPAGYAPADDAAVVALPVPSSSTHDGVVRHAVMQLVYGWGKAATLAATAAVTAAATASTQSAAAASANAGAAAGGVTGVADDVVAAAVAAKGPASACSGLLLHATIAKLLRLLRHESVRVAKPALRAVGNVVCAEDERDFTQVC